MGMEKYVGGGFLQDTRWKEEQKTGDGNSQRVSFLKNLKLAPFTPLEALSERIPCPMCNRMSKYYCFQCFCSVGDYDDQIPKLELPVKVTILSHPKEKKSKSSVVPVKILAPQYVDFLPAVEAPDLLKDSDLDVDQVAILFPGENATEVTELSGEQLARLKRVVIIDSTWNQTKRYMNSDLIKRHPMVKIKTEKTVFWRYQSGGFDSSLSSAEALYFFFRDYDMATNGLGTDYSKYSGKWDNLLWYFAFNFKLIQDEYKKTGEEFRRIPGFIQADPDSIFVQSGKKDENHAA